MIIYTDTQIEAIEQCVYAIDTGQPVFRLAGYAGSGKCQPIYSAIQTPNGPVMMRDVNVGDQVIGCNGKPTEVKGVYPQGKKHTFKVTFRDGAFTYVGGEHLWAVYTPKLKMNDRPPQILTTEQLIMNGLEFSSGQYRYYIPLCKPIEYAKKDLPIPAYSLGVFIGDGTSLGKCPTLVLGDLSICNRVKGEIPSMLVSESKKKGCTAFRFHNNRKNSPNKLAEKFRSLFLDIKSPDRFIPSQYLVSSIKQRQDLLHGLMDTDGSCCKNRTSFSTHSKTLARDVIELVQSLGGTAILRVQERVDKNTEYSVNVKMFTNPFSLTRKAEKWSFSKKNPPSRAIISIEKIGESEHKCISVEARDGLYLTDNYIVTHNTTCATEIQERAKGCQPAAFTGKAALRLREKGLKEAATIHSCIYNYDGNEFVLKDPFEVDAKWWLIDEGSMVSTQLWEDLLSFDRPIILLGDPGQLEPVGDDPRLMHEPDYILTEIHRQALESGIIQFATDVRHKREIGTYPDVTILDRRPLMQECLDADIVLCGRNRTRVSVNNMIRRSLGFGPDLLEVGEKIICLRNNRAQGTFNGQIFTVEQVTDGWGDTARAVVQDGDSYKELTVRLDGLNGEKVPYRHGDDRVLIDYGYAITVHKSQGSEWDNVLVIDEQCDFWTPLRWRYTAITRAAEKLTYCWR